MKNKISKVYLSKDGCGLVIVDADIGWWGMVLETEASDPCFLNKYAPDDTSTTIEILLTWICLGEL